MSITDRAQSVLNGLFGNNGGGNAAVIQGEARRLPAPGQSSYPDMTPTKLTDEQLEARGEELREEQQRRQPPRRKRDDGKVTVTLTVNPKKLGNSYRFDADDPDAVVTNVYVRKEAFRRPPTTLTITLESDGMGPLV